MSAQAYARLHPGVQEAIFRMGWEELHPIQSQSIEVLLGGDGHLLVSAQTAGGKTEAAFLPIISRLAGVKKPSVQALYVGPLVALINDQFQRLEKLCEAVDVPVHRWHGAASAGEKKRLREQPGGILLITPESLESNFINYGTHVPGVYAELEFVVIDELHSFLSNVRGVHLRSLLARLRAVTGRKPRMVGLSATLGDPKGARTFLVPDAPETVALVQDASAKRRIQYGIKAYLKGKETEDEQVVRLTPGEALKAMEALPVGSDNALPLKEVELSVSEASSKTDELDEIAENMARAFGTGTNLIFGNAKRGLEILADRLRQIVEREQWPVDPFLVHHGSLSKGLREEAEHALKTREHVTAFCSSTLEMGIDIGAVKRVGQLDVPWSVAALVQRMGRSGRREGQAAILRMYVRDETPHAESGLTGLLFPNLLQAVALSRLMMQKWLEPHESGRQNLSTLMHQILSCLRQTGGMHAHALFGLLVKDGAFPEVSAELFVAVCRSLGEKEIIEQMPTKELILAPKGEQITAGYDFYAAFASSEEYTVRCEGQEIGKLQTTLIPPEGECLILAGRRWLVKAVLALQKTVEVAPAKRMKAPNFRGPGGEIHTRVVQEMRAVLMGDDVPEYLDEAAQTLLRAARAMDKRTGVAQHGVLRVGRGIQWYPWLGTRGRRTLELQATCAGLAIRTDELSITYLDLSWDEWRRHLGEIVAGRFTAGDLAKRIRVKEFEKFDWMLSEELLDAANALDRLDLKGAVAAAREGLGVRNPE